MNVQERIRELAELRREISEKVLARARDQYERSAIEQIESLLREIEKEYAAGTLKPKKQRYGYIGRLVAESDPDVLPTELGGKLMNAERLYIESGEF